MKSRKELKKKAKLNLKKHYFLFVFTCALAAFIGSEFTNSFAFTKEKDTLVEKEEVIKEKVNIKDIETAKIEAKQKEEQIKSEDNKIFGRKKGVFSYAINSIDSGSFIVSIIETTTSIINSRSTATILLIVISFLSFFLIWYFIIDIYKVIERRIILEGRTYNHIPIQRFTYLFRIKKWLKVSFTMFVVSVLRALWNITIIGAVIKKYSYYLVPFILAENPDINTIDAINLSRRMMNHHKWECFKFEMSFIWWEILGAITGGITNIMFLNPYKIATFSEYYNELRTISKKIKIENSDLLSDKYLYEKASKEEINDKYKDIIELSNQKNKKIKSKKGIVGFINNYLGITTGTKKEEEEYEKEQLRESKITLYKKAITGETYPTRLYIIPEQEKRKHIENINYLRRYSVVSIILLFFIFSIVGWIWEVCLSLITDGVFVNRGTLQGPWLPIYGWGGVLILVFLNKLRNKPLYEFNATIVLCGIVEYFTSYYLEITHNGQRWWDYSGYFINLNGRICAEGLLVFGLGGLVIVYFVAPYLDNYLKKINKKILVPIAITLVAIFTIDQIYSNKHPNIGQGITIYDYQIKREILIS